MFGRPTDVDAAAAGLGTVGSIIVTRVLCVGSNAAAAIKLSAEAGLIWRV